MSSRLEKVLLILIVLLAFGFRLYNLTTSPAGLYIDETSIGYNAYSILKTGHDEHGIFMPLFFEAFGEYKLPVYIYSVVLTQLVLGPTDASVRLPAVIYGAMTVAVMYVLAGELGKQGNKKTNTIALIAAFLLAISPWHFQFTHAGFEASAGIFFLCLGIYLFFKSLNAKGLTPLILSGISFALSLYSYNSARIVVPVLVVTLFLVYRKHLPLKNVFKAAIASSILLIPFVVFSISPAGLVRAQQVSIFFQPTENLVQTFVSNYWKNISPITLFLTGEPTIAHLTPHRMALLPLITAPFFSLGLVALFIKGRKEYWFVFVWLLIGFVPPAITTLNPHALRGSLVIPAVIFITALGVGIVLEKLKQKQLQLAFGVAFIVLLSGSTYSFLNTYHQKYTRDAGWDWQVGIKKASAAVFRYEKDIDAVYFSDGGAARIAYLWWLKVDPQVFQSAQNKDMVGKYHFGIESEPLVTGGQKSLYITSQEITNAKAVQKIVYPNESPAYVIYSLSGL